MSRRASILLSLLLVGAGYNAYQRPTDPRRQRSYYTITNLEPFTIEARVLSAKHYAWDREAVLAPVDLALGWGPMADPAVYEPLHISQSGRWYSYHWGETGPPISEDEIISHSANMHMIPATPEVERTLKKIGPGQWLTLQGHLVEAVAPDGWKWRSSLSRTDRGGHSCELVLVDSVTVR